MYKLLKICYNNPIHNCNFGLISQCGVHNIIIILFSHKFKPITIKLHCFCNISNDLGSSLDLYNQRIKSQTFYETMDTAIVIYIKFLGITCSLKVVFWSFHLVPELLNDDGHIQRYQPLTSHG